jgi:hypothetical protein
VADNREPRAIDGHRLTEFIYGTVTALVAVAGIDATHVSSWYSAALVVTAGGAAFWLAHAYSSLMSNRITSGHRIEGRNVAEALSGTWPIVTAAILVALPFLGSAVSLYGMGAALWAAKAVGVLILALVGFAAGAITRENWARRVLLVLISSGLGLLVVAVELAIHH